MSTVVSNKVAASAVAVAMLLSFAFAPAAKAATVEELTAQIASLLSTISSLQAQLAGMTGGTTGGTTTGSYNFTMNHKMGDNGGEVMDIQKFLNANGFAVAATGAGSPGQESSYFGAKTKAAVIAWQNANAATVLAPVGLSAGTGYWGASSRAAANAMGGTTGGTTTPTPTGTGVTVAAAAQPANGLAVNGAANVPFTKFTVTNNSGVAQTINSVTVQRGGLLDDAAFSSVVLLDQNGMQIGNSRTLNSVHQASVGEAVTLNAGASMTFTVAGNMASSLTSYAGQVGTLSVVAVNTSATVAGSLPITGAAHTMNASLSIGTVTANRGSTDPNSTATKEIGTTGYTFSAIKLTAGSAEAVRLHSVRFNQSGSASASDVTNVMAYVDGVAYTPTVSGDYYTVNFGSGLVIAKGLSKDIEIKGDIIGGTNRTVAFDVYKLTDINVTGETYGYGITPTADGSNFTSSTPTFDASVVTISAGSFNSISKSNAAPAGNIAVQSANQILGAFTVDLKGEPVTIQTVTMTATIGQVGGTPVGTDLDNVTLVDQNGVVLAGPVDATGAGTTATMAFGSVNFPAGSTTVYVKGYLDSSFVNTDTIVVNANSSAWSGATGDVTGDTVTIPSTAVSGNTMTVQSAALVVNTLTQPAARSIVPGAANFLFATASLDAANSGEDVRVTSVTVTDTSVTGLGTEFDNVEIWANLSGGAANDSTRGDRFETRVKSAEQMTGSTGANTLAMPLDSSIIVAKNTAVEIAVIGSLASAASASDTHTVKVSAATVTGVTSGSSVTATFAGSGQTMTVAASGTLTTTIDSSTPVTGIVLDTTAEQTSAVFRLAANSVEDLDVDSIKITSDGSDDAVSKYVFYHGATKLGEVTGGQDTAELFLTDGTLTIPANDYILVTVKVVMNNVDGTQIVDGDTVVTTIAAAGDVDTTGKDSGVAVDSTQTSVDGNTLTLYQAYPVFAFDNTISTVLSASANYLLGKLTISNPGDKDVTFNSTDEITIQVEVAGTLSTSTNAIKLESNDGTTYDTVNLSATTGSAEAVIAFATNTLTIPAGGEKIVYIRANTGGLTTAGNSIQAWLSDDTADNIEFDINGASTDYSEGDVIFRGDIYGAAHVKP